MAQRDLMVSHANLWQIATERAIERQHALSIDRIFNELEARGAHISPSDRSFWAHIQQWLQNNP